jgi:flavin-dependent dehydrogenase
VVEHLRAIGLGALADSHRPIEGARLVYDFRHVRRVRFRGDETGRCIAREELDQHLLQHALAAGARFRRASVEGLVAAAAGDGDGFAGVTLAGDDGAWLRARHIVAADGAASRLRQACGFAPPRPTEAYAVRAYARVEKPLDPLFEGYAPIEHGGSPLPAFGWVFPLDEHRATVGLGCYRGAGLPAVPPPSELFDAFVRELRIHAGRRLGDVDVYGEPQGSPVATAFALDQCEHGNVLFAGDAAGTVDPYTGEGIGNALKAGDAVAAALSDRIRRAGPRVANGVVLARRFPRLVQNAGVTVRLSTRAFDAAGELPEAPSAELPPSFRRALLMTDFDPGVRGTPAWEVLARSDPEACAALDRVAPGCLDAFRTSFPFASEMLQRELKARTGPTVAALALLAARAGGAPVSDGAEAAALAAQALGLSLPFLMNVDDEDEEPLSKLHNGVNLLIFDYVVSRGWRVATVLGADAMRELGTAARRVTDGLRLELEDLYDIDRTPERCVQAARATSGETGALAVWLGAEAAEIDAGTRGALSRYAADLCVALRVAGDTTDFVAGENSTGKTPGMDALAGIYGVPVAYALGQSRHLRREFARGLRASHLPRAVELVRHAGGVEHARSVCRQHVDSALSALEEAALDDAAPFEQLAALPDRELDALDGAGALAYASD